MENIYDKLREEINNGILREKSMRTYAKNIGINVAIISRILSGSYIPSIKWIEKYYPILISENDMLHTIAEEQEISHYIETKIGTFRDFSKLKEALDILGYEVRIVKKESKNNDYGFNSQGFYQRFGA